MAEPQLPPSRVKRFFKFFTKSEWVNVFLTAVIAGTGVVGIILVIQGSNDTARIRDAAEKQAQAAKDFANTAASINKGVNMAVSNLGIQAGEEKTAAEAMKKLASATETSVHVAQTALQPSINFGIDNVNVSRDSITFDIKIINEGGSSAIVTLRSCSIYDAQLRTDVSINKCKTSIRTDEPLTVLPHRDSTGHGLLPDAAPAIRGDFYLYTAYELSYTYANVPYTLSRCFVYDKSLKTVDSCGAALRNQKAAQQNDSLPNK
jgi:hypothetical protein